MDGYLLSVVIPVFNERDTIGKLITRVQAVPINKEIIIVDDYSSDGSRELMQQFADEHTRLVFHPYNRGKGAALRTGFEHAKGHIVIIQDADLEYNPGDFVTIIQPILAGETSVVYGSRFLGDPYFASISHYLGNRFLTHLTNLLFGSHLTDMETCYKAFRRDVLQSLPLTADRFDFEPEVTALLLRRGYTISEVPISYAGRSFGEGKKISWHDGIAAVRTLLRCRLALQPVGRRALT